MDGGVTLPGEVCAIRVYDGAEPTILVNGHILHGHVPDDGDRIVLDAAVPKRRLVACASPRRPLRSGGAALALEAFAEWLANGEVGLSQLAVVQRLTGVRMTANGTREAGCSDAPRDPSDFRRCLRMFDMVPIARQYVHLMRDVSPAWMRISDRWEELEDLYREEAPTGKAPRTYERLKALQEGTGDAQL